MCADLTLECCHCEEGRRGNLRQFGTIAQQYYLSLGDCRATLFAMEGIYAINAGVV